MKLWFSFLASTEVAALGYLTKDYVLHKVGWDSTFTVGSAFVAAIVVIVAGLFTIRDKRASIWENNYKAALGRVNECEEEIKQQKEDRAEYEREQTELRHALKEEIGILNAKLAIEEARHDITGVVEKLAQTEQMVMEAFARITTALQEQSKVQQGQTEVLSKIATTLQEGNNHARS